MLTNFLPGRMVTPLADEHLLTLFWLGFSVRYTLGYYLFLLDQIGTSMS